MRVALHGSPEGVVLRKRSTTPPVSSPAKRSRPPRESLLAAERHFQIGYRHLQAERYSDALVEFQRAAALDATDPRPHHGSAKVYEKLFLMERAEQALRKAIEVDPTFVESKKKLTAILHDAGKFREAVQLLEPLAKQYPKDTFILGELAINLRGLGDLKRAIALLKQYNDAEGRQAWGYAQLGRAHALLGEYERAEALYREAMAIDPAMSVVGWWLGQLLAATGREEESKPLLQRYRKLRELQNEEHNLRVSLLSEENQVGTLVRLAEVLFLQGKRSESLVMLARARQLAPNDAKLEQLYRKVAGDGGASSPPPRQP